MGRNLAVRMLQGQATVARRKAHSSVILSSQIRPFHSNQRRLTDGVYKELTEMRIRTPWIEALREAQNSKTQSTPVQHPKPDLTPKKMSDSYVSLVLPLAVSIPNTTFIFVGS